MSYPFSVSPYASPIMLVEKKNGQLRQCTDYSKLNKETVEDSFPLPRIEETFESFAGATLFSSLDPTYGYYQVAMHNESVSVESEHRPTDYGGYLGDLNFFHLILYFDYVLVYSS